LGAEDRSVIGSPAVDGALGHAERLRDIVDRPALHPNALTEQGSLARQKPGVTVNLHGVSLGCGVSATPSLKEALLTNVDGIYS
jgi:hypothetical protein